MNSNKPEPNSAQNLTSLTLLQKVQSEDQTAWDRLVDLYSPMVLHWCQRMGVRGSDAEDICQEVWVATAKSIGDFAKTKPNDSFRAWLFTIARYRLLDFLRQRRKGSLAKGGTTSQNVLARFPNPETLTLDDVEDQAALSDLHLRALELIRQDFEPTTWQAFWQVVVEERRPADVAVDLNMSSNAVRMAKSRVLRRLREELGDVLETSSK